MKTEKENEVQKSSRHQFKSWFEYFFAVNNLCIGLSNFLIFPAKVHEYRGGAFIIAYLLMLIGLGYPVLYLELILGQFHRCSPIIFIRRCVPILQGFGWMALISAITILYPYQYSVARAFKFIVSLARSRSQNMPWSSCENPWNTEDCYQFYSENCPDLKKAHMVFKKECVNESSIPTEAAESAEEQYIHFIIHKTGRTHMSFSNFDYGMVYSILIIWLSIAFFQNRVGTKATPLIYIPTIYIFLICPFLLVRSLHLDGALDGVREMFRVEWAELLYSKLWIDALHLVIQSLSIGIGGHTIMSSFAPPKNHTFQIATLAVIIDTGLSLIITATLYSILGYITFILGRTSVYDVTMLPSGILLTHSIFPVLLRRVAHNAWLWIFLYYTSLVVVGWKSCALVLKTITVILADIFTISTRTYFFDLFSMLISIIIASSSIILCYEGGPLYIPMIQDVQKVATGLFITAELLIVVEFYGLDMIYADIHSLMGLPSRDQWSIVYTWSIWKWRWRMAPAFSFIYVISAILREYPSPENDLMYYYFYDFIQFFIVFFLVAIPFIFAYHSYLKMFYHMEKHEKTKSFSFKILWHRQRHLRSWSRIEKMMESNEIEFADKHLPEKEPEDLERFWKTMYNHLLKSTSTVPESEVVNHKENHKARKMKKKKKEKVVEEPITFETYHENLQKEM